MAVAHVLAHTAGTDKTAGTTTVTATLAADSPAGNTLFLGVALDNQTSTTPVVSTISKPGGETAAWGQLAAAPSASSGALAGVLGELWAIKHDNLWTSGTVITVTISVATTAKVDLLEEFSGVDLVQVSTAGTSSVTTGLPSAVTSGTAPPAGSLIVGFAGFETIPTLITPDLDTTGGSWSAGVTAGTTGGTNISNGSGIMQYKILTSSGHQTYNPTGGNDSIAIVVALQPSPTIVAPPPAPVSVVAPAPVVTAGATVTAALGVLTVIALAPSISAGALVTPPPAVVILSSPVPQVNAAALVDPPAGVVTITNPSPDVSAGARVDPPPAVVRVASPPPDVIVHTDPITPAAAVVTVVTPPPTVGAGATVDPTLGAVTVLSPLPDVKAGATILAPCAVVVLRGVPPDVSAGAVVQAPLSVVSVTGVAPVAVGPKPVVPRGAHAHIVSDTVRATIPHNDVKAVLT